MSRAWGGRHNPAMARARPLALAADVAAEAAWGGYLAQRLNLGVGVAEDLQAALRRSRWLGPRELPGFRLPFQVRVLDLRGDQSTPLPRLDGERDR